jgi:hypothetical protein
VVFVFQPVQQHLCTNEKYKTKQKQKKNQTKTKKSNKKNTFKKNDNPPPPPPKKNKNKKTFSIPKPQHTLMEASAGPALQGSQYFWVIIFYNFFQHNYYCYSSSFKPRFSAFVVKLFQ